MDEALESSDTYQAGLNHPHSRIGVRGAGLPPAWRAVVALAAVGIAYFGQFLLTGDPYASWQPQVVRALSIAARHSYGWMLLAAGGILFFVAYVGTGEDANEQRFDVAWRAAAISAPRRDADRAVRPRWVPWWRWLVGCAAVGLYGFNIWDWWRHGETGATRWMWAISVLILIASQLPRAVARNRDRRPTDFALVPTLALLGLIVGAAFWLRFVDLDTLPFDFHGDFASGGLAAREILEGKAKYLFGTGFATAPQMHHAIAALSLRLFGDNLFGLNMSGVVAGMATLVGTYLLAALLFSRTTALLATGVMAIGYVDIHFSRQCGYMYPVPFMTFGFFLLMRGLRDGRGLDFVLAGVNAAMATLMYFSGRITIPLLGCFVLYLFLWSPRFLFRRCHYLVLLGLGAILTYGPMIPYFIKYPDGLMGRAEVFLFDPSTLRHLKSAYHVETFGDVLIEQLRRSLLMFNASTDRSTQFGFRHPMLNPRIAPLLILGVAYGIARLRRPTHALILIWLTSVVIVGATLTGESPFWPRLLVLLPPAAICTALGFQQSARAGIAIIRAGRWQPALTLAPGLALLVWTGLQNWQWYTEPMRVKIGPAAYLGRQIAASPPETRFCMIHFPRGFGEREVAFLAQGYDMVSFFLQDLPESLPRCLKEGRVWVFYLPDHEDVFKQFQSHWPDARTAGTPPGPVFWYPPVNALEVTDVRDIVPYPTEDAAGKVYRGKPTSSPYEIDLGVIALSRDTLEVYVAAVKGSGGAYDYLDIVGENGEHIRVEAEDSGYTSGDTPTGLYLADNHWWLQGFDAFSGRAALVAQRGEMPPELVTRVSLKPGKYSLRLGSFTGDAGNGPFAVRVRLGEGATEFNGG